MFLMSNNFRSNIIQAHFLLNKIFIIFNRHHGTRYRALRKYSKNVLLFFNHTHTYGCYYNRPRKRLESYVKQYIVCTVSFTHISCTQRNRWLTPF